MLTLKTVSFAVVMIVVHGGDGGDGDVFYLICFLYSEN